MKVIFLDIDGVLQAYDSKNRFGKGEEKMKEEVSELSKRLNRDYSIYNVYDVEACYLDWDKEAVERIKKIIKETGAKIVISSDWRSKELVNKMKDFLKIWDMEQYWAGETGDSGYEEDEMKETRDYIKEKMKGKYCSYRAVEILDYVRKHEEITNYVAIDDMDLLDELEEHFVKTKNLINNEQAEKCIEILNDKKLDIR